MPQIISPFYILLYSLINTCHVINVMFQGKTILMLTKVPFFKEVIISSFECNKCGYHDNSIQSGSKIQDKGAKYTITVETNRVGHQI